MQQGQGRINDAQQQGQDALHQGVGQAKDQAQNAQRQGENTLHQEGNSAKNGLNQASGAAQRQ